MAIHVMLSVFCNRPALKFQKNVFLLCQSGILEAV
jgi:hypothetical protein